MSKCVGCGVELQNTSLNDLGYVKNLDNKLCERCFKINNYNDYRLIVKDNNDFINILKDINKTKSLVVLVVDIFNVNNKIEEFKNYISNEIILVLTKRDILPKSCYDKKLIEYFQNYNLNIIETIIVSSYKNYNLDNLMDIINLYKKSNDVYVVGFTNSGKSTLINKIIYNYSTNNTVITTSSLPSTTISSIEVKVNDNLTLIDTPGLLDTGDLINYISLSELNKIICKKEIKPITYQIKKEVYFKVDELLIINAFPNNNLTFYMSNKLIVKRYFNKIDNNNLCKHILNIEKDNDIVIQGLGFIKCTNKGIIILYTKKGVNVYVRKNLI